MKKGILIISVLAFVAAAFLPGCGSDESSTASDSNRASGSTVSEQEAKPLSKAKFLDQAEQICEDGVNTKDEDLASAFSKLKGKPSSKDLEEMAETIVIPVLNETIEQIDDLEPPPADQAQVDNMVQQYEDALRIAERSPSKAINEYIFGSAVQAAEDYGLTGCSF